MKYYKQSKDVFTIFDFNKFYAGYFVEPNEKGKRIFYFVPCYTTTDKIVVGCQYDDIYVRIIDAESTNGNFWYVKVKNINDWICNASFINVSVREFDTAKERYQWVADNL